MTRIERFEKETGVDLSDGSVESLKKYITWLELTIDKIKDLEGLTEEDCFEY